MGAFDAYGYKGKRVLVVGGATGMGGAAVELLVDAGAEVLAADYAPITQAGATGYSINLADKASIEAFAAQIEGPIDAHFAAAGVADKDAGQSDPTGTIAKINWVGHRYLIDLLIAKGAFAPKASVTFISSAAGLGWEPNMGLLNEWTSITDFDAATQWAVDNEKATYQWTKRAICYYVAHEAFNMLKKGIRLNAILPGPTDTPLAQANKETWLGFGADYRVEANIDAATPMEQAYAMVFLGSTAASAIAGITLITDDAYMSSGLTESFPGATPIVQYFYSGA
jgi:NAD(P)-dependent dehydrogenase (short-subunit alcohol dehydrogenase family)